MKIPTGEERIQARMMLAGTLLIADVAARGLPTPQGITTAKDRIKTALEVADAMLEAADKLIAEAAPAP